uniref:Serine/threonine-protein phosphatase 6 regulatory ankyrin repeat subunit B-like isoform X2 n=1 Tax=Crassostrea virginica TaxID=6565 RepID=A0A8B8B6N7_CRAVI|nr:serine/threonine-protein phosphatase 6 regulatory ankyrin repeat subunit B-like isoform X2 [Crassostrea virginica]
MASTSYAATEEMTNLNRVSRLLMGPCTDQLRDLLRFYIPLASFLTVIQREKLRLPRLTGPQWNLILPSCGVYSGNYNDMDISLLYILLRNLCGIQAHNMGWGNIPDSTDRSVSANIERIRLARNECSHFAGGMSKTEFNRIWSNIKGAVVDLDKYLGIGNKFQEKVDFVRNDTMDPARDKHFSDQLLEQMKEIENVKKEVDSLKSSQHGIKQMVLELKNDYIPPNVKEQHKMLLETWRKEDSPFHEIHSFPTILDKIQSQQITTIIGSPGSGKTTTARHLALRLQTDCEFEIVPVDDITEIKQYGHPKCKQIFILDDVIGVWGFKQNDLANLDKYSESIFNVLREHSKILFTCRKAVYNEATILFTFKKQKYNTFADLKSFALAEEFIIDLEDKNNRLNDRDRSQMLKNHCIQKSLSLSPEELPNEFLTGGLMMYPLLCKLFCSESKYRALGKAFFETPYTCILDQMEDLKGYKPIQYASLVLCMFCQNKISEGNFRKQDSRFMQIKKNVFENCRVSGSDREIIDALNSMINTFTTHTKEGYSLIHDSVYEVLAFHYGNKHQEDMLQYMSSSFVAKKFYVHDNSDGPKDLRINFNKEHFPAFAERLVRDLKSLELHDVFMNEALKEHCICNAFIDELKKLSYCEIKKLFFIKQQDTSKIFIRKDEEIKKGREENIYEWQRQKLLMRDTLGKPNIRVISWVIAYGHCQLLQFLFDLVTEHKESICRVMDLEIPEESGNNYISSIQEQTRLLTLSCYNDNLDVVKLLLKHFNVNCINYSALSCTPLATACSVGYKPIVDFLIRYGAKCNIIDGQFDSPLYEASLVGHADVVDLLIKGGADCNQSNKHGRTPLYAASLAGHVDVVDLLIKGGADCNQDDEEGSTPLHAASLVGKANVVDLLIKGGAICNQDDQKGSTPLHAASLAGHHAIEELLYELDRNGSDYWCSNQYHASLHDYVEVADLLIKGGAECNQSDKQDRTPLYAASLAGHVDVADLLIKGGANCNQGDKIGSTPLYAASLVGKVDVVDLLIKGGAVCNQGDQNGSTPLYAASLGGQYDIEELIDEMELNICNFWDNNQYDASFADYAKVADLLIKSGADCNEGVKQGRTPLYAASMVGNADVVDLLIKGGANCNQGDEEESTPLHAASRYGHAEVVDLLIKAGANCNEGDKIGSTPLYAASLVGKVDVVDLLIKGGAVCNQGDQNGSTPLYAASLGGHHDIEELIDEMEWNLCNFRDNNQYDASFADYAKVADLLIKSGADCNEGVKQGRTPLYAASMVGNADVVDLLIKGGANCNQGDEEESTPLHAASRYGHAEVVDLLIKAGANCNQGDKEDSTPLHAASRYGHTDVVDLLIKGGANFNQGDEEGSTPLHAASMHGHADVVDLLIKGGANCNQGDEEDSTPLHAASLYDHADAVDLLIKGGANCNQGDEEGSTPLYAASRYGHAGVVDLLIKGGANCNQGDEEGSTPLHAASRYGHAGVVDLLIKGGANCNQGDKGDRTPLHAASRYGHAEVVDLLIKAGANCNQGDKEDSTPLHAASRYGHTGVVDLLIKGGANFNQGDEEDSTPLHAASRHGHADVVDLLIKGGANCNQGDEEDSTPLHAASLYGHADAVDLLIKGGANCNQGDEEDSTPLYAASRYGHAGVVDLLIKGGANCNQGDEEGSTPLHAASRHGHADVVDLLIKGGANCNQGDEEDSTPLHAASLYGHADAVDLLIKGGANCNQGDEEGTTPLYVASMNGNADVVDLLIKSGANCNQGDKEGSTTLHAV